MHVSVILRVLIFSSANPPFLTSWAVEEDKYNRMRHTKTSNHVTKTSTTEINGNTF